MWRTIAAGHPWHGLICNRARDGRWYWVNSTIVPMRDAKGSLDYYISIRTDVTALVEAQESLERSGHELQQARDAADLANRMKSAFMSSMSHELRTPMNAILGFTQLLQLESLGADIQDSVEHIDKAGRHLMTLINEVLDLSRIEAGKIELSMVTIDINDLLTEATDIIGSVAQRRGIELNYLRPAGEAFAIDADRSRLNQVVLNLISNAIKYNRPQGKVDVFIGRKEDRLRISVADTGIGLSPQDQKLLYIPYTRFGPRHIEGTGIGLTITKRLVEAMGGTIGVDSQPNVGSTFWIEFRRSFASATGSAAAAEFAVDAHGEASQVKGTLLYIEDSLTNQEMVRKSLKYLPDLLLLVADEPHTGLALAAEHLPDMILLDIMLPELDGFEVFKRLRSDPRTRHIPVVAVSANAMPDDLEKARLAGFDEYLTKPVDIFSMRSAVRRHLQPTAA